MANSLQCALVSASLPNPDSLDRCMSLMRFPSDLYTEAASSFQNALPFRMGVAHFCTDYTGDGIVGPHQRPGSLAHERCDLRCQSAGSTRGCHRPGSAASGLRSPGTTCLPPSLSSRAAGKVRASRTAATLLPGSFLYRFCSHITAPQFALYLNKTSLELCTSSDLRMLHTNPLSCSQDAHRGICG